MRALPEDAQLSEPLAHPLRMPMVAVSRDDELVPIAATSMTLDGRAETFTRGSRDGFAVLFRRGRIAERLMRQIAAIADQVREEDQLFLGPAAGIARLGKLPRQRDTVAGR